MNQLTSSLIHSVATDNLGKNWVFSPASYLEGAYRVVLCANGDNQKELAQVLGSTPGALAVEAARFEEVVRGFESYNCLLSKDTYRDYLVPAVLETLTALGSDVLTYASPDEAVEMVNRIVAEKTRGKITDLLSREQVKELTQLIILNCVYFKRQWYWEFDKPTYDESFNNADGSVTKIGLLKVQKWFDYHEADGYDLVKLPYRDSDICCYLWVPTTMTVQTILDQFDKHYTNVTKVQRGLDCHLTVPPFTISSTLNKLVEASKLAGVHRAFEETQEWGIYDWVKMNGGWAKLDAIIQKAYIDFSRTGTEAAAATAFHFLGASGCMMNWEPPKIKYIRADKPFVYALVNSKHPETPLFVGAVNQLS